MSVFGLNIHVYVVSLPTVQGPSDNWPGALDHLDISLVDDRYKKTWKNK